MKLVKCYISSFGNLKDFSYDFTDGVNTVKEDNGFGKSTFASFIKAMFYGLSNVRSHDVEANERIKYRPWNSTELFGGYVIFEHKDRLYRVERFFGKKDSDDTLSITDPATGKAYANTKDFAVRLFGVDEEGFLSTVYFSQKEYGDKKDGEIKSNTSLTTKFNAMADSDFAAEYDLAINRISEKIKEYKKTGDKGLIADLKRKLVSINDSIERVKSDGKTAESIREELKTLIAQKEQLEKDNAAITEEIVKASRLEAVKIKKDNLAALKEARKSLEDKEKALSEVLNNKNPDEEEMKTLSVCMQDYSQLLNERQNAFNETKNIENANVFKVSAKVKAFGFTGAVLTVGGVAFLFINLILGLIFCGVGIVGLASALMFFLKDKKSYSLIKTEQNKKFEQINNGVLATEEKLKRYFSAFNLALSEPFALYEKLKSTVADNCRVQEEIRTTDLKILELQKDTDVYLDTDGLKDINNLKKTSGELSAKLTDLTNKIGNKNAQAVICENSAAALPDLLSEKEFVSDSLKQRSEEYRILTLTENYLKTADDNLKARYRTPLQESFEKYVDMFAGKTGKAVIDVELKVNVEVNGSYKETGYYSKGYRNLFELCKRFALLDVVFQKENPFVILDDPFYNLDDDKIERAVNLVRQMGKERQIIYFTCHESRRI